MEDAEDRDELFEEVERRALFALPEEDAEQIDVLSSLRNGDAAGAAALPSDMTLGGYIELHNRVPAFEGSDGQPYTVDVAVEETGGAERPFVGFLMFIRWAATGAGIMDHAESGDLTTGLTEEEARQATMELSLYEVKAELDAAIERRRAALED
jgi:hypothetical protein